MNHQKSHNNPSTRPFIKLDNITIRINDQLLFPHTNWLMETGQHWAIIGPNGSGKSVLANAICRKLPIHEGQISYFFKDTNHNGNQGAHFFDRDEIVMVSPDLHKELAQQYGGYHQARWQSFEGNEAPTVSVYLSRKSIEHISPYEITPFKTDETVYLERRRKAIELLNIENLLERKILHLSNGETRKTLLARALIQAPKLLILDDPFGGLDTASRHHLKEVIETILSSENMQILLITSRYEEIPEGIGRLLEVENNQIVFQGPKQQVFQGSTPPAPQSFIDDSTPVPLPAWKPKTELNQPVLVDMKNVKVSYHGITVLTEIDWTVKQGEYWAVLGDNGAGKTTLLSLILADNPQAYSNEIYLFGQKRGEGESIWDIKRNIGWISPELQMYYSTRSVCLDVICSGFFDSIGIYQTSSPEQQKIALDWMRFLSIPQLANTPFYKISIGQQRLVLLARALVKSPLLLIFDEPCQGLDISYRQQIINLLDRLCQETPVSLIYVTHYFQEMPKAIDRWLILEEGRIKEKRLK